MSYSFEKHTLSLQEVMSNKELHNPKMADPIWRSKNFFIYVKLDQGVFGITDYESAVEF